MSQDQEQKYGGIWTKKGLEKLAAFAAGGNPINITESAFGDGNGTVPTPEAENTSLVHEVWRGRVASVTQKEGENSQSVMVEVVIPYNVGGFFIREWGLYDADGDLVVYGNHAEFYKALLIEGTGAELRELIELPISSKGQVQITVNYESLASVDYVLNEIEKHNQNEEVHNALFSEIKQSISESQDSLTGLEAIIQDAQKRGEVIDYAPAEIDLSQPFDFNLQYENQQRYIAGDVMKTAQNAPFQSGCFFKAVQNKGGREIPYSVYQEVTAFGNKSRLWKYARTGILNSEQNALNWNEWLWIGSSEPDYANAVDISDQIPFLTTPTGGLTPPQENGEYIGQLGSWTPNTHGIVRVYAYPGTFNEIDVNIGIPGIPGAFSRYYSKGVQNNKQVPSVWAIVEKGKAVTIGLVTSLEVQRGITFIPFKGAI